MAGVAEKINNTQDSFDEQKTGAVAACPFAAAPVPQEAPPPQEETAPDEMKIFPGETETEAVTPPVAQAKKEEEKKAWIEIVLADMDGNPMPGVKYRITPPNGEMKEDFLNEYGQGGYYDIESGSCKISFPDLDKDAWD